MVININFLYFYIYLEFNDCLKNSPLFILVSKYNTEYAAE